MADKFPSAEVIGTDLSPTQPGWVPPNCKFEIDDCTEEWTFKEDWQSFYSEVYKYVHLLRIIPQYP
jgi:hypothetical protein